MDVVAILAARADQAVVALLKAHASGRVERLD
jgi:hypothetical protein